jgi:hypothetical protein
MHNNETVEARYRVPAHEAIWTALGPGALVRMAAMLRRSRTGWIVPVGAGVTHHIVPVAGRANGQLRWTVEHWVCVEGRKPLSVSHMDDYLLHEEISLAEERAVEMVEWLALNPQARVACPWCFETLGRNELAAGHNCPV